MHALPLLPRLLCCLALANLSSVLPVIRAQGYLLDDATTGAAAGITLNEISARSASIDFNADGVVSPTADRDEYIELLNTASISIDLGGWTLCDNNTCLTFAAGTTLDPGHAVVVFTRGADVSNFDTGPGNRVVAAPVGLQLSNASDAIGLRNEDDRYIEVHWGSSTPSSTITTGATLDGTAVSLASWGDGIAQTRFPDGTGAWHDHLPVPGTHTWSLDGTVMLTDPQGTPGRDAAGIVLPVELTGVFATVDGNAVLLRWHTASETNNAGFEIQGISKNDPASPLWEVLGFVEGAGTTTQPQTYTHHVGDLAPGRYIFRLKQIDYDGRVAYSPMVDAAIGLSAGYQLSRAYPNPFNRETSLSLTVARPQQVEVSVYDLLGHHVATLFAGRLEAETVLPLTLDGSRLPAGLYLLCAQGPYFKEDQVVAHIP